MLIIEHIISEKLLTVLFLILIVNRKESNLKETFSIKKKDVFENLINILKNHFKQIIMINTVII